MATPRVSTWDYRFSHRREPRGRGSWAFHFFPDCAPDDPRIIWVNGTYTEAKKQALKIAAERDWDVIHVLP